VKKLLGVCKKKQCIAAWNEAMCSCILQDLFGVCPIRSNMHSDVSYVRGVRVERSDKYDH
jgi:hypothetical protein